MRIALLRYMRRNMHLSNVHTSRQYIYYFEHRCRGRNYDKYHMHVLYGEYMGFNQFWGVVGSTQIPSA